MHSQNAGAACYIMHWSLQECRTSSYLRRHMPMHYFHDSKPTSDWKERLHRREAESSTLRAESVKGLGTRIRSCKANWLHAAMKG